MPPLPTPPPEKSFETGQYRDLFQDYLGKSDSEVKGKLDAAWSQLFYGDDDVQRIYYPVGDDMAYIEDIGNSDVRTEGMSYGMMIAVQLDKKAEFDRLWKWAKTYMYHPDDPYKGYFAWHCTTDGRMLDSNPASDGEEWFVMALFFASARWGDGEGIFNYRAQAQEILDTMLHTDEQNSDFSTNMFNAGAREVVFVPKIGRDSGFTDPSYHLPAYYELWALWANRDNQFWAAAAQSSRDFFKKAANPQTGLMPDYANFDGTPYGTDEHKDFRFDAWRTLSNVAVDYSWFGKDPWEAEQSDRVLGFLASQGLDSYPNQYSLDGKTLAGDRSTGLAAMAGVAALAADPQTGKPFVQALWDASIPFGQWRYYDGMLYLLALLHVSGNFRIFTPGKSSFNR
ncbi:MAG TPA: glycosyl hydrolase family 8 [Anaerolineales bacterium]|nr:glycosyl hydrolase family 8 [Anaerolineales bacterium]